MATTGNKQASIAYRVRDTDGAPLDINGDPTSESGLKQAIALLEGTANPNPELFEVQFYFAPEATITGNPTVEFDPAECSIGFIGVTPNRLLFDPEHLSQSFTVISSGEWALDEIDPDLAGVFAFSIEGGVRGTTVVTATTTNDAPVGQGYIYFKNVATGQRAKLYFIHVNVKPWILENGEWNMLGFWYDNGLWNY